MEKDAIATYRIASASSKTLLTSTVADDMVSVSTDHFSIYALADKDARNIAAAEAPLSGGTITTEDQGAPDVALPWILAGVIALAVAITALVVSRKFKAQKSAKSTEA